MDVPPTSKAGDFKNWLIGALALNLAKEGLTDFVETEINELQKDLIQSVVVNNKLRNDVTCTQCTYANLFLCPTPGLCNRVNCEVHRYHQSDKKRNQPCPNHLCNYLKDAIREMHRFHSPAWQNSDARRWSTEAMEICKCFLPSFGYERIHSIQDIDFNGIMSFIINNRRFQLKMASALSTQRNVCTKAHDVGQAIRHSDNFELSDMELSQHIEVLKDLLSDQAYLANDAKAGYAIEELTELQKTLSVTTFSLQDMMRVLQDIFRAQICEETLRLIGNNLQSTTMQKELSKLLDRVVKESESDLRKMKQGLKNFKRSIKQNIDMTDNDYIPAPSLVIVTVSAQAENTIAVPVSSKEMSSVVELVRNKYRDRYWVRADEIIYKNTGQKIGIGFVDTPTGKKLRPVGLNTPHPSDADITPGCTSTEPTKEIPNKETQLLHVTKKWEDYIKDDDKTIEIESLIDELGLPTTELLNKLQREYLEEKSKELKKSEKLEKKSIWLKTIEHRVCKVIMSNNKDIQYAFLAFTAEETKTKTIDVQLIVEVKQIRSKINCENIPYRLQVIQFDDFSKEAELLIAKLEENQSFTDVDAIQDCINRNATELMKKHKHLSIINASTVRSKDFYKSGEVNDIKENCIVFYVRRKGLIPVGEVPFEDSYDGFPIDVREGVFYPSMQAGNEGLILKMGLRIKAGIDVDYGGTLGGFIDHPQYGVCGFTCAHVLLDKRQMNMLKLEHEMSGEKCFGEKISVYLDRDPPDSPVEIGHVVIAILTNGDDSTPGMDVAFFQIEKSLQVAGVLANINNADIDEIFDSGKVYLPTKFSTNFNVSKYGSVSGKTEGKYYLHSDAVLRLPVKPVAESKEFLEEDVVLHNQILIRSNKKKGFFSMSGDSGSLVIMDGYNGERFCIGIVEGHFSAKASFVTPLGPILEKNNLSSLKCFKEDFFRKSLETLQDSVRELQKGQAEILKLLRK